MADALLNGGDNDDDIFVYTGGRAPRDVRRAKIDESIDTIPGYAFYNCRQLIEVEGHDKLKKIKQWGFWNCRRLRLVMKMTGVKEIEKHAFYFCYVLSDVDFDKLEIVGDNSFSQCKSLKSINLSSVRRVGQYAFQDCEALTDAKFGEDLEEVEECAFHDSALRRIAIPLKDNLIDFNAFIGCRNLYRVDIVGGIHKTISSLHMESWRDDVQEEIESINQTLPDTPSGWEKSQTIQQWIRSVLRDMEQYKAEHKVLVKEAMVLLELALWKAKLLHKEGEKSEAEEKMSKKAKIDKESARKEHRVTCGANVVIKNVLPFLQLKELTL